MRYILGAKVRPGRRADLLRALEDGTFGQGFPYGDLGEVLCTGRVDATGTIRWVEVCYCRESYGVAMEEELPYLEAYLTDIEVADALNPIHCKGYPECNDCNCTRKVRFVGEPLLDHLRRTVAEGDANGTGYQVKGHSPLWQGWRGRVSPEEARRNRVGIPEVG
jgi:hypothetical protein